MSGAAFGRVVRVFAAVSVVSTLALALTSATEELAADELAAEELAAQATADATADATGGGSFVAVVPSRVVDTRRAGEGPCVDGTRSFQVAPSAGVPADAAAVSLNVTVTAPSRNGFLTVFPTGEARPTASNLNYAARQTVPNAADVKVGQDGRVSVFSSGGCPQVILDVVGYYTAGDPAPGGFVAVTPARVVDTRRAGEGPCVDGTRSFQVAPSAGVPADAAAVSLNVTVTAPSRNGFLTVFPAGEARPTASNLNFAARQTVPNAVTARTGVDGEIAVSASAGCPEVIVDVVGYVTAGEPGPGGFTGVTPSRVVDTRLIMQGPCVDGTREFTVAPSRAVPSNATALALNVTVTDPRSGGFLTVFPAGGPRPTASNLNFARNQTVPNAVKVRTGAEGRIAVYASGGCPTVIVDVVGFTVGVPPANPAVDLAVSVGHACVVLDDGTMRCWGNNSSGQLGNGAGVALEVPSPQEVTAMTDAVQVATGASHTCAVLGTGTVQCWGSNDWGQLGDGTSGFAAGSNVPVTVSGLSDVVGLAASEAFTCAVRDGGEVWCWGSNEDDRLGQGDDGDVGEQSDVPVRVHGITTAASVTVGRSHACARLADGSLRCWGDNTHGTLGDGTDGGSSGVPRTVSGITDAVDVSAGVRHTCAVLEGGTARCWGFNGAFRPFGNGTTANSSVPVPVSNLTDAVGISGGDDSNCALRSGAAMSCWGRNDAGQMGIGLMGGWESFPAAVERASGVSVVANGYRRLSTCVIVDDGSLRCWGSNMYGQLGNGSTTNADVPIGVIGL